MPKHYPAAPNVINQDDVGFIFQDLKQSNPRVWQAITSLRSYMPPIPFYAEIILPGVQTVANDVLDHPCILRLPVDPYGSWEIVSVIIQEIAVSCKIVPSSSDYVADVLITRNGRVNYYSLFQSTSSKAIIRNGGDYWTIIDSKDISTKELFNNDEFRVDVLQADGTVADVGILIRGYGNIKKLKRDQP